MQYIVIEIMCNVKFNMLWTSLIEERSTRDVVWEIMMAPCCENECFKSLRYVDIKKSRYRFLSLANITKERNFILDYLKVHLASDDSEQVLLKNNNILFMIKGVSVCKNAWLSTLGISVRRFSTIFKEYTDKGVEIYEHGNKRKKRCSPKTCECLAWLNFLVNSIGDHQPDSALIHLPSCFTKLSLYKRMCRELDEHVIVSQSQFYNLMEKQLPNVVIPKVKMTVVKF
jgi:hypothetical protein